MESIISVFARLSTRQRLVVGTAALAALVAFLMILRVAAQPGMALLYSGLDASAAGEVVQSLEQQGAIFDVRGGAIYVDSSRRDALRLTLAAEGKPANGSAGYELLDSLSGFGTTSQMFDAAYWRAKEGELARTIMSSPLVRSARVHISNSSSRPFARDRGQSASVTVMPAGTSFPPAQARALKSLVASAVAGLDPEEVSVIDGRAGRVVGVEEDTGADAGDLRAAELRRRAERILEARVGLGNAIVEVSVETVTESEQIRERRVDPDSRVMISSETEERTTASTDARPGAVTVASNLPDGDGDDAGAQSSSDDTETRERVNYEVSETMREVVRSPGAIARMTVAVLVNVPLVDPQAPTKGASDRGDEELEALRDLVASAVGLDERRGDVITIRSMPFETLEFEALPEAGVFARLASGLDLMKIVQLATLALVSLILGLFVVRPILTRSGAAQQTTRRIGAPQDTAGISALPAPAAAEDPVASARSAPATPESAQRLVRTVGARQDDAAELLRGWMQREGSGA